MTRTGGQRMPGLHRYLSRPNERASTMASYLLACRAWARGAVVAGIAASVSLTLRQNTRC